MDYLLDFEYKNHEYKIYKLDTCLKCKEGNVLLGYNTKDAKNVIAHNCKCSKDLIDVEPFIKRAKKARKEYLQEVEKKRAV